MSLVRRVKGIGAVLLGLALLAPAGWAHDNDKDKGRPAGRGLSASQYGIDRGYQDGLRHGLNDRNRRAGYNYRSDEWRHADRGYDRYMGARGQYIQGYRDGYVRGYDEAYYGRNSGWGRRNDDDWDRNRRPGRYGDAGYGYDPSYPVRTAQGYGAQDGAYYAQADRNGGKAYNPTGAKGYRDADHGYDRSLGSKADFQRIYREAFVRAYQQAFGGYGYRRR